MALGWSYGVLWYVYLLMPEQGTMYYFSTWSVYFDFTKSGTPLALLLTGWNSYIQFTISPILYVLLFFALRKKVDDAFAAKQNEIVLRTQ